MINLQEKRRSGTQLSVEETTGLLVFLQAKMGGMSRTSVKSLLTHGRVLVNGKLERHYDMLLQPGDKVCVTSRMNCNKELTNRMLRIVFEDNDLIVVQKKAGLLTMATAPNSEEETAFSILREYVRRNNSSGGIFIVHRLDRETSGLLLFAKNRDVQHYLRDNWQQVITDRAYVAVVDGVLDEQSGTVTSWLTENLKTKRTYSSLTDNGGKKSITHYKKLLGNGKYTLLELHLETGRTNQIRVQMTGLGHPVVGDRKYGNGATPAIDRLALHARSLAFTHPVTGQNLRFETPIPKEFLTLIH